MQRFIAVPALHNTAVSTPLITLHAYDTYRLYAEEHLSSDRTLQFADPQSPSSSPSHLINTAHASNTPDPSHERGVTLWLRVPECRYCLCLRRFTRSRSFARPRQARCSAASDKEHQVLDRIFNDRESETIYLRWPSILPEPQRHLVRFVVVGE